MNTPKLDEWSKRQQLKSNIERCRELYETGILLDGSGNPFIQSVFIELMIRLRHAQHCFDQDGRPGSVTEIRDAGAHPHLDDLRWIEGTNIYVEFGRIYDGNWKHDESSRSFVAQDDSCDVRYSYGDHEISAKEIGRRINEYEDLFAKLSASKD